VIGQNRVGKSRSQNFWRYRSVSEISSWSRSRYEDQAQISTSVWVQRSNSVYADGVLADAVQANFNYYSGVKLFLENIFNIFSFKKFNSFYMYFKLQGLR